MSLEGRRTKVPEMGKYVPPTVQAEMSKRVQKDEESMRNAHKLQQNIEEQWLKEGEERDKHQKAGGEDRLTA